MTIEEEFKLVSRLELFEKLPPAELKRLIFVSERFRIQSGEYLFRQSEATDIVFAVLEGEFSILIDSPNGEVEIAVCHRGELVGEMAAISGEPRTASIRANTDCEVIGIEREHFINTVTGDPQTALKMMQLLVARLAVLSGSTAHHFSQNK